MLGVSGGASISSRNTCTIASQTSRTMRLMVFCGTRLPYCISLYVEPDAMCQRVRLHASRKYKCADVGLHVNVMATFYKPGSKGARQLVVSFVSVGLSLLTSSSNISGGILMKFLKARGSSFVSFTISLSYIPSCGLWLIHWRTHMALTLRRLISTILLTSRAW